MFYSQKEHYHRNTTTYGIRRVTPADVDTTRQTQPQRSPPNTNLTQLRARVRNGFLRRRTARCRMTTCTVNETYTPGEVRGRSAFSEIP